MNPKTETLDVIQSKVFKIEKSGKIASELISAYEEVHKKLGLTELARKRSSFIAEAGNLVGAKLDYESTVSRAAQYAVPFLGDACVILVLEDEGGFRVAAASANPSAAADREPGTAGQPLTSEMTSLLKDVIDSGNPIRISRNESPEFLEVFASLWCAQSAVSLFLTAYLLPLILGKREIGVMILLGGPERDFSEGHSMVAREYGDRVGMAIEHSRLYGEVQVALKARDEFISVASHELRNPVAVLKLQLDLLDRLAGSGDSPEASARLILRSREMIGGAVAKLSDSINQIFDVTRLRNNQFDIARAEVNLTLLVEDALARIGPVLQAAECEVRLALASKVIGNFDRVRMEQVVVNLVTNAAKYAPRAPIEVALSSRDGRARLSVRDHGPGIPLAEQSQIFDCFFRLAGGQRTSGLGLGLYICKRIVDGHGGRIWVESRPNEGAQFIVEIPL